jgi:hypothetical protein
MSLPPGTFALYITLSTCGDVGTNNTTREATEALIRLRNYLLSCLIVHTVRDFDLIEQDNVFVNHAESQAVFIKVANHKLVITY